MPVEKPILPGEIRKKGELKFKPIKINYYQKTLKNVKNDFPKEDLVNIYKDMRLIREVETMIQGIRLVKTYNGVDFSYTGPAHLSIGQEASAVGQAYVLEVEDYTFGTHRSHGEVIAKSMSAIRKLSDEKLMEIMETFKEGKLLKAVKTFTKNENNVKKMAVEFMLYGFICEVFGKENGFTGGLGNSMHVFFTPFGVYPNNAIVGGSASIGSGAALYKKLRQDEGIIVVNSGDGSLSTGHVWEGINFSTMDQLTKLWEEPYKGGLPIIFNFMNNSYAMSGQTYGETMGYEVLARIGAAFNPEQMHAERVDGYNPFAVIDAFRRKKQLILEGKGPVILDTVTYRHSGHSVTDQNAYRDKAEQDEWLQDDCIAIYKKEMLSEDIVDEAFFTETDAIIKEQITEILKKVVDDDLSPRMDMENDPDAIAKCMFSNQRIEKMAEGECEVIGKKEENSRYIKNLTKIRSAYDADGKLVSPLKVFSYRDAIFESILDKFYVDPTMILFGEDVREHGNSFGVLRSIYESIPRHRMFNTPIAEQSIVGAAVGYALCGGRAVPEIMWGDFLAICADEIFNQMAKWQGMSAGILKMPLTLRISVGAFYGAQHSQDWTSLAAHVPGLKLVYPATPYDAKGLLNSALSSSDPVIYFESQKLYDMGEMFEKEVPADYYEVEIGKASIKREGKDITIVTLGPTLYEGIAVAKDLKEKWGVEAEIIDARSLVPFDYECVIESVKKTGKVVIVSDACERGGYIKTIASNITELAFDYLDAPPVAIGCRNTVSPCPELEKYFFPKKDSILDNIHQKVMPLDGYKLTSNVSNEEKIRREKLGI